ncbi:MAG: bifunctional phosphoglucose/phosphomannose isomerase [Actinomycetota bacterium]
MTVHGVFNRLIGRYDPDGILDVLTGFPRQVELALELEVAIRRKPRSIVVAGMGGSALGGQLVTDLLRDRLPVPLIVHRDYAVPEFVDESSLVVAISYSGDTEETVSAFESASKRGAEVVAISSGGRLKAIAERRGAGHLALPQGIPPRMAWAYLSLPLIKMFAGAGLCDLDTQGLSTLMSRLCREYQPGRQNEPIELAHELRGLIPIYCSSSSTSILAYKWKINTNENAKQQAFASVFPELNHNEMMGWRWPDDSLRRFALVFLRTDFEGESIARRIELTKEIVGGGPEKILEFEAPGRTKIEQLFASIYAGDFMSYYLALLNHENPGSVAAVEQLKARLAG